MTYVRPDVTVLAGMGWMGVATVLQIVGVAAPGWGRMWVGEMGDTMVGLWEFCYELPNFTCESIEGLWNQTGWLEVTRCFGVLAILMQMACVLTVLLLCCLKRLPLFFVVTAWTALTSGLLIFVELAIFIGVVERKQNSLGRDFNYDYAFVLTVLSFVFSLLSAILFFIGEARHRKTEL